MPSTPDRDDSADAGPFRVAVTVFTEVPAAIDQVDAGHIAVMAVRAALARGEDENGSLSAPVRRELKRTARVVQVMETGMAAGNGYLWLEPTGNAYREAER